MVAQAAILKLALLDVINDRRELFAIARDFPELLALLPEDPRDFFSEAIWRNLHAHDEAEAGQWEVPGQGRPGASEPTWLQQAGEVRGWLRDRAIDPEGMVLTPGDVRQMHRIPELVFLNCCHLARVDGKDSDREQSYRLAANLSVQFIDLGVRTVGAAGWAVNDLAALTFAKTFYRRVVARQRFGDAVRLAREQTWREHRAVNTWGAYQCYGDPDFTLGGGSRGRQATERTAYVCPSKAVVDLSNLRADAHAATPERIAQLREGLQRIEQALQDIPDQGGPDWLEQGDVAEALGLAQGELGRFEDAVASLERAISADDACADMNAIEQRARYQAQYAKELCLSGEKESQRRGQSLFRSALESLRVLARDPQGCSGLYLNDKLTNRRQQFGISAVQEES